jgi:Peptidase family M48
MRSWRPEIVVIILLTLAATAQDTTKVSSSSREISTTRPGPYDQPLATPDVTSKKSTPLPSNQSSPMREIVDRAIEREHGLIELLKNRTPLIETYLQELEFDPHLGPVPVRDRYFLGRVDLRESVDRLNYLPKEGSIEKRLLGGFGRLYKVQYNPIGFSWMMFADRSDFNRKTYDFKYLHREFLGDVRCLVFEVTPRKGSGQGRFEGRVWLEDQNYNIVRFNGIYGPRPRNAYFFHMDSWRLNLTPGYWVPAYIYSEEGDFSYKSKDKMNFKAQTRLWGYDLHKGVDEGELTEVLVDSNVKDESSSAEDASPVEAQRRWMQQAGDNVIERLQNAGLLAPVGELNRVLETVVNNLLITNNITFPTSVHVRVLLTSPIETFSVGNTIVVSRGLVDVLPDEASLAAVLSHELAHIVLGHSMGGKYAFSDRLLFSDESTYRNFGFRHFPMEEDAADKKAIELLKNSPYGQKLNTAGLFLRELSQRAPALSALLTPHLGDGFTDRKGEVTRMAALMNSAPALDPANLNQVAALPLGTRVKLNPWDGHAELIKGTPVAFTSAREKMPLEVTPFFPRLTRLNFNDSLGTAATAASK